MSYDRVSSLLDQVMAFDADADWIKESVIVFESTSGESHHIVVPDAFARWMNSLIQAYDEQTEEQANADK
jgi:hypothetical protein